MMSADKSTLYIGNKNYSSWSFRAWLALKYNGIGFEEVIIPLRTASAKEAIGGVSPSGKVPCFHHQERVIWDSLAIAEYAHEIKPEKQLLPSDLTLRSLARSAACEMHSGFMALRSECPMDMKKREKKTVSEDVRADLMRIYAIWDQCRTHAGNKSFLLGEFSLLDAFFAPVVSRIISYGLPQLQHQGYIEKMQSFPLYQEWEQAALKEVWQL